MTERTKPASALEALAQELGIVAARFEHEALLKIKTMRGELELSLERRLTEQAKEIAELRGQISVLLTRAARTEPDRVIDFNEARAVTRRIAGAVLERNVNDRLQTATALLAWAVTLVRDADAAIRLDLAGPAFAMRCGWLGRTKNSTRPRCGWFVSRLMSGGRSNDLYQQ